MSKFRPKPRVNHFYNPVSILMPVTFFGKVHVTLLDFAIPLALQ